MGKTTTLFQIAEGILSCESGTPLLVPLGGATEAATLLASVCSGTRVDLLPLNEAQQMEIATAMRGDAGARIVDQARRTAGVRELVTIPLYLTGVARPS